MYEDHAYSMLEYGALRVEGLYFYFNAKKYSHLPLFLLVFLL